MICLCDVPVFVTVFWELFISTVQTGLRANFVDWRHQNNSGMSPLFSLTNRRATEEPSSRTSAGYKSDINPYESLLRLVEQPRSTGIRDYA